MLVKLDRKDIDAMNFVCALSDYKMNIYTVESNPSVVQVELVDRSGAVITPCIAFMLGRMLETRKAQLELKSIKI
jgi:hypothetical protein